MGTGNISQSASRPPRGNCYHCEKPACIDACPHTAIFKEDKYGAVLIDQDRCQGERECFEACPYGAIVYASAKKGEKAHKCTMCIDRLPDYGARLFHDGALERGAAERVQIGKQLEAVGAG